MNDLGVIAFGSGLRDGLNPCIFMTCAFLIVLGICPLYRSRIFWWRLIFLVSYFFSSLIFNFGPAQVVVLHNGFMLAAKGIYFILGLGAFVAGVLFFKDWVNIRRGRDASSPLQAKTGAKAGHVLVAGLTMVVLAAALSALATIWPINTYIMLLGNGALIKGQIMTAAPLLVGYGFSSLWPLWFVWSFISIKKLKSSLLMIVSSAIFFTASSTMILLFK